MPRVPQSHNSTTPVEKFDNTAYDAVELVAENIDDVILAAGGVDVMALYLGASETEPTEGKDGAPLVSGNFYLDTTSSSLKYWDNTNSVWVESDVDTVVTAAQDAIAARDAAQAAQTAAETAETNATIQASNAASSASASATSASESATSASNASVSEGNAATSANNAANSATAALASENAASTSAGDSATSATDSANSASASAASESNAAASAVSAANSASQAEAAFDNFDDMYLGRKTVEPTVDNDGNPLQVGASYWHDNGDDTGEQRFWNGASWESPELTATQAAQAAVAARDDAQISETNAANSASAAGVDANNAGNSATAAANSASAAAASETAAEGFKDGAETAQSIAQSAANAAGLSESNAAASATNAATSEAAAELAASTVTWKVHTRGEAELDAMREANKRMRASSGFDHYGRQYDYDNGDPVNEGMWSYTGASTFSNKFGMGAATDPAAGTVVGASETLHPVTAIAGFISELLYVNHTSDRSYCTPKLPEVERGYRIFSKEQNARGTGKWYLDLRNEVDPKYGNVAPSDSIAVSRAFEGLIQNGDFRSGDNGAWAKTVADGNTINIGTGLLTITKVGTHWSYISQSNVLTIGEEYVMEFWSDEGSGQIFLPGNQYLWVRKGWNRFTFVADTTTATFQVVANAVYYIRGLCIRPITEEVVIARHDVVCGEFFLEEVSQANPFVYPKGMIQSQALTMNGITTVASGRPVTYYAVYTGDTGSAGKGVDFWAATDQQKIDMVSDHSNNIFMLADGRVVQWRMRQRTFRGYGNGDWYNTDPTGDAVGFQPVPYLQPAAQGINDSVNDYFIFGEDTAGFYGLTNSAPIHDDPAVFKAGISGATTNAVAVNGECYLHVWARVPRLNIGAYHPSHNPRGTSQTVKEDWSGWAAWETSAASPHRTRAGAFQHYSENVDGLIDTANPVGSIAIGLSGRRDGRFYDAVYAGGMGGINDDRLTTEDGETLVQRAYAQAIDGTFRGEERQKFWRVRRNVYPDSSSSVIYMLNAMGVPSRDDIVGGAYANDVYNVRSQKAWVKIVETGSATLTAGTAVGIWYECDIVPHPTSKQVILNPNTGTTRWIDSGNSNTLKLDIACAVYVDENNNSHTVSGLKNQIDVIGAPGDVTGREDVAAGWEGDWIGPSRGTGSYNWLSRYEYTTNMASNVMIILQAAGTTYYTRAIDHTRNRVTSIGTSGDVGIIDYNTQSRVVKDFATRKYSLGETEIDHVYATSHNEPTRGGLLREAFLGITDAGYGNSTHPHSEYRGMRRKTLLSSRLNASSGTREYEPVHSQVSLGQPAYNTQALKMVMHPFATDRKVGLNFVMNELRWVGDYASLGVIDVNDTNQTDDGVSGQLYRTQGTWNGVTNFKLLKCLNAFAAGWNDSGWLMSGVDGEGRPVIKYGTNPSGTPYMRLFGTQGDYWGDRGSIWVPDLGVETFDDEVNTVVMAAQMILSKPIGYTKNIARVGEVDKGVDF